MYQQLWGYKVEEKLYLAVREQKRLNTTGVDQTDRLTQIIACMRGGGEWRDSEHTSQQVTTALYYLKH
jgi:hypothetical protein